MKKTISSLILVSGITAPAVDTDLIYKFDKFTGNQTALLPKISIKITSPDFAWTDGIDFGIAGQKEQSGKVRYSFRIYYISKQWIFMNSKSPMIMLVDGNKKIFSSSLDSDRRIVSRLVTEHMLFDCTREDIEQIIKAKMVEIQISGAKRVIEFQIYEKSLSKIQVFLDKTKDWGASESPKTLEGPAIVP